MDVNLVLFKKNGSRKILPLPSSVTVIGRRRSCDLCIPLTSVSRRHCQLYIDDGVLKVRDLKSRNGTHLNGKRINEAALRPGDCIEVGSLAFVFQIDGQPRTVSMPKWAMQKPPQESTSPDLAAKDLEAFTELEDLEEPDELKELDELDGLEELDDFEELGDLEELDELDSEA